MIEELRAELEAIRRRKGTEVIALIQKAVNNGITVCLTVKSRPEGNFVNEMMKEFLQEKSTLVRTISVIEATPPDCLRVEFADITN